MKRPTTHRLRHLLVITAAVAAMAAWLAGNAMAYTVVTRDGHRIHVKAKPEIRGLQAWMRLQPHGMLATMQEDQIDWEATEAANPAAPVIAVPSSTKLTESPASPARPIEVKIMGTSGAKTPEGAAQGAAPASPQPAQGAVDQKKVNAQEAVIKLQKEYAQVAAARDQESAKKQALEHELAQLQARDTGYASENSTMRQRIRELQDQVSGAGSRISQLESRLAAIRVEVVQLGGSVD